MDSGDRFRTAWYDRVGHDRGGQLPKDIRSTLESMAQDLADISRVVEKGEDEEYGYLAPAWGRIVLRNWNRGEAGSLLEGQLSLCAANMLSVEHWELRLTCHRR